MMTKRLGFVCAGLVAALLMAGCGDDDDDTGGDGGGGNAKQFTGVLTGATETGILNLTFATGTGSTSSPVTATVSQQTQAAIIQVSGTIKFGSAAPITLSGTYDDVTFAFMVSGGGYTLMGNFANGVLTNLTGSYTGPNGGGSFTALPGTAGAVNVYCGTYTGTGGSGRWNLVEGSGGMLSGSSNPGAGLTGTRTGNTINLTFTGGTATGTVSGTSVSGTYTSTNNSGTWTGSVGGCSG